MSTSSRCRGNRWSRAIANSASKGTHNKSGIARKAFNYVTVLRDLTTHLFGVWEQGYDQHFESHEVQDRDNALGKSRISSLHHFPLLFIAADRMRSFGRNLHPFARRSGGSGDESTESGKVNLEPLQPISRPRQDASDDSNFGCHDFHTVNFVSTANRVPEPEQSEKVANYTAHEIVLLKFSFVFRLWKYQRNLQNVKLPGEQIFV